MLVVVDLTVKLRIWKGISHRHGYGYGGWGCYGITFLSFLLFWIEKGEAREVKRDWSVSVGLPPRGIYAFVRYPFASDLTVWSNSRRRLILWPFNHFHECLILLFNLINLYLKKKRLFFFKLPPVQVRRIFITLFLNLKIIFFQKFLNFFKAGRAINPLIFFTITTTLILFFLKIFLVFF